MKEMPSLVSWRLFTLVENRQGRGSYTHTQTHICFPPHQYQIKFPVSTAMMDSIIFCLFPLWPFVIFTASALGLKHKPGRRTLTRISQSEKSDDCSSDEWTVKHYLWFRGFFLKVPLRGSSQTSTTAPALLPRRRFKWQSRADVRQGCFATKPRQKNKNDIIRQDKRKLWFTGADEAKRLCCFLLRVWSTRRWNPDEGYSAALFKGTEDA